MRKAGPISFLLLLAGCASHGGIRPLHPLELATAPFQGVAAASLTGSLLYENNCLLFRPQSGGAFLLPVWPTGSIFNGTAVIFHEPGKADQPIMISQQFVMSGQPLGWPQVPGDYAPFQHQCPGEPFMVSEVRPAD